MPRIRTYDNESLQVIQDSKLNVRLFLALSLLVVLACVVLLLSLPRQKLEISEKVQLIEARRIDHSQYKTLAADTSRSLHQEDSSSGAFSSNSNNPVVDPSWKDFVEFHAPPSSWDCHSITDAYLCIWYPVTFRWYLILSSIPRFIVYDYEFGEPFSITNFGFWEVPNYLNWEKPWVYVQTLLVISLPAIFLLLIVVVSLVLFLVSCAGTCCFRYILVWPLIRKEATFPRGLQIAVKVLMAVAIALMVVGLVQEFTGFTLQREAVSRGIVLLEGEVVRLRNFVNRLGADSLLLNANFTIGPSPSQIAGLDAVFDAAVLPLQKAEKMATCAEEIPLLIEENILSFSFGTTLEVIEEFYQRNYGCPDLGLLAVFTVLHTPIFFQIFLAILVIALLHPFPPLLFSNLALVCILCSLFLFSGSLMNTTFLSDCCEQVTLLEEQRGTDPFLNAINPPHFILSCAMQDDYLDPILSFVRSSLSFCQNIVSDAQAIVDDTSKTPAERLDAQTIVDQATITLQALLDMVDQVEEFADCQHFKDLYFSLKDLLCQVTLEASASNIFGSFMITVGLVVGIVGGIIGFVVLRIPKKKRIANRSIDRGAVVPSFGSSSHVTNTESSQIVLHVNPLRNVDYDTFAD